jgi:hypothetical protein
VVSEDLGVLVTIGLPEKKDFVTPGSSGNVKSWSWLKEDVIKKHDLTVRMFSRSNTNNHWSWLKEDVIKKHDLTVGTINS